MNAKILVVDDEKLIRWSLHERLNQDGFEVIEARDGAGASTHIEHSDFDLALCDLRLPDTSGMKLLKKMRACRPETPVIIITAYSSVDNAIEAMKEGAYDYITKPFNLDEMSITVKRALDATRLKKQLSEQTQKKKMRFSISNVIGSSPAMNEIKKLIKRIARSEAGTVLLRGESGVGKDVIAKAIHFESERMEQPFMNITCTALADTLLESELFGHEKGAFTDAKKLKKGLLELADGGSVFLDEIGDMSPVLQAKLLRFLEERSFRRVGGDRDIQVNVRVIAATNRDLEKSIHEGTFREDLYYRLNILPFYIPPLRERGKDVVLLAEYFTQQFNREFKRNLKGCAKDAMDKLSTYHWPGNVRELKNVIERAVLLCENDHIRAEDIMLGKAVFGMPAAGRAEAITVTLPPEGCRLEDVETDLVKQSLNRTRWNQTKAAKLLGISRDQIRYKMQKFGLKPP